MMRVAASRPSEVMRPPSTQVAAMAADGMTVVPSGPVTATPAASAFQASAAMRSPDPSSSHWRFLVAGLDAAKTRAATRSRPTRATRRPVSMPMAAGSRKVMRPATRSPLASTAPACPPMMAAIPSNGCGARMMAATRSTGRRSWPNRPVAIWTVVRSTAMGMPRTTSPSMVTRPWSQCEAMRPAKPAAAMSPHGTTLPPAARPCASSVIGPDSPAVRTEQATPAVLASPATRVTHHSRSSSPSGAGAPEEPGATEGTGATIVVVLISDRWADTGTGWSGTAPPWRCRRIRGRSSNGHRPAAWR